MTIALLLALTFIVSIVGLLVLVWAISNDQFGLGPTAAKLIFAAGEVGVTEDPAAPPAERRALQIGRRRALRQGAGLETAGESPAAAEKPPDPEELADRLRADLSSRTPVLAFLVSAVVWLLLGSLFGLLASVKMHWPDFLVSEPELTFGRVRPMHLNAVAYGWVSMAGIGVSLWLIPRLFKTALVGGHYATAGAALWNFAMAAGMVAIAAGYSDGLEWLEFPWPVDLLLVVAGGLAAVPLLMTVLRKRVAHLYVSSWYLIAALVWFPILFLTANVPGLFVGTEQAVVNWWFAHNVLGLWITPLALAAAYYFIPKVIGRPIYSYNLSLIGFWALALFYSQVGIHHLIGGPVPTWLVTLSIVQSVMMVIPVVAVAVNHHLTMVGHFRLLKYSPTLRFVVLGAMMYTLASLQGSIEALRSVNTVTHFTHYTVGHAHLGAYGFASFILFGSMYFILPRLTEWEWPHPRLIALHFWLAFLGFGLYFLSLSVGGWLQGLAMLDPARPFMDSMALTLPYLKARSLGGLLMTLSHLIFAAHFFTALLRQGPRFTDAALWRRARASEG